MEDAQPKNWKYYLKRFWNFIWHEESFASWLANLVLAFVLIKFVVYPGLGFLLGTTHPIVAVVSGSMEHDNGFDEWWAGQSCCDDNCARKAVQSEYYTPLGITKEQFLEFPYKNGFNKGDLMVLASAKKAEVGDVLVFMANIRNDPIIHRIVKKDTAYNTKGDHNCGIGPFEKDIQPDKVIGKAVLRIPLLGWIKIGFVELLKIIGLAR
ncbi:hypothetical protein HY642_00110 [Candidatus Woesearchaeota archaeon]|nr:hypothetical protein [Candidatus Woesearchaeota archaeon]